MRFIIPHLNAQFSATFNRWKIKTEKFEFDIQYMIIDGYETKKRLGATIQEVIGKNVEAELVGKHIILRKWDELETKHLYDCFDVDRPRNLAKVVTVK